jgi:signal transduction histidine kinase
LRTEIEVALFRPRDAEEYCALLGRLHAETVRMTNLVENLLSLARADGGAEALTLVPISMDILFGQLNEIWMDAMNQAMLDFRVELPDGNLAVLGDSHGLVRLLSILLENASKFTPPGGSVTLRAIAQKHRVVLVVQDTGIGIAPEHKPRIFDRFYRTAPAGEPVRAGSGLGLCLAKWLAERHGTELRVESEPGHGSHFSFSLQRAVLLVPASHAQSDLRMAPETEINLP